LGLTTPLTIALAIGRLARQDILVKSGAVLERLSHGGKLLLDKTGTITAGKMEMVKWVGDPRWQPIVAQMERHSNHPIGRTLFDSLARSSTASNVDQIVESGNGGVTTMLGNQAISVGSPRFAENCGVFVGDDLRRAQEELESSGATAVIVAADNQAVAIAGLADRIRDDSRSAIQRLRKQGFSINVLSGDAPSVVAKVAAEVGIAAADAVGGMTPEEKLARVEARTGDEVTVMVGDGVNDAAALAGADVGIAVHGGAEASLSAADVYMAQPGLSPLVTLVAMSRRTMRTVRRNLIVSLGYNLIAGSFAAAGLMTPLHAAIIMPISSASVLALAVASIGGFSWRIGKRPPEPVLVSGGSSWK
jgi:Cu2+-exporting ATPase